ncbi:MAG: pseudouridine synthase, partial [Candidatus Binatia bacterium]
REGERLQKVLARAGYGSRRACEDLIKGGRVRVNGEVARLGMRIDAATDAVEIEGVRVNVRPDLVYLALNKPVGVLTTAADPRGRPTVMELVPPEPRVFPVGRLDRDTGGLIFLTNDGEFANRIAHPRYEVPKTYVAEVAGKFPASAATRLERGVELEDGRARASGVRVRARGRGRTLVELTVREGRNRLVRRMFDAVGTPVASLQRTAVGPVRLGRLRPGTYRKLDPREVLELLRPVD